MNSSNPITMTKSLSRSSRRQTLTMLGVVCLLMLFFIDIETQKYLFFGGKEGTVDSDGINIFWTTVIGVIGLILLNRRLTDYLIIPFLVTMGYLSTSTDFLNFTIVAWFLLALYIISSFERSPSALKAIILVFSLFFFVLDLGFIVFEHYSSTKEKWIVSNAGWQPDPVFVHLPIPNNRFKETKMIGPHVTYRNVEYVTDAKARRICGKDNPDAKLHVLFFGCSFTWGDGVLTGENLPCRFQEYSEGRIQSYNYAIPGSGTGHMFTLLKHPERFDDVTPRNGIAVYCFMDDHIRRNVFYPQRYARLSEFLQHFKLNDQGRLLGPFRWYQDDYLKQYADRILMLNNLSPIARFKINRSVFEPYTPEISMQITAKIIIKSRDEYRNLFGGKFYVMIWQNECYVPTYPVLERILSAEGIPIIRVPDNEDDSLDRIPHDYHLKASGHDRAAKFLWANLKTDILKLIEQPPPDDQIQPGGSHEPATFRTTGPEILPL